MSDDLPPAPPPRPISDAIRLALEQTSTTLPADKHGAVSITASLQGVEASAAFRIREGWTAGVWGASDWTGKPAAGARVQGTW